MASGHERIETNIALMVILVLIVSSVGGWSQSCRCSARATCCVRWRGSSPIRRSRSRARDVYVREGCYVCHSQMIRPFRAETERYGHYSVAGEFVYDRPFQWGSRPGGPRSPPGGRPLQRRVAPRAPDQSARRGAGVDHAGYPWLAENPIDGEAVETRMRALRLLGHPYTDEQIEGAADAVAGRTEMDAMIAYLQGLGTAIRTRR